MGEHQHKAGEMMLGYRLMTINMQGLQSGTDAVETYTDVLKDFMMATNCYEHENAHVWCNVRSV